MITIPAISDTEQYTLFQLALESFKTVSIIATLSLHPRQRLLLCQEFQPENGRYITDSLRQNDSQLVCNMLDERQVTKIMFGNMKVLEKVRAWSAENYEERIMQEACRSVLRIPC
jgi:hypothetical protein